MTATTRLRLPRGFNPRNPQMRRDLASSLRAATHNLTPPPPSRHRDRARSRTTPRSRGCARSCGRTRATTAPTARTMLAGPSAGSSSIADAKTLERRVEQRTNTVARQFDRVCDVLETLGYLADDDVTELGKPLRRIYSELDLVVAEALRTGVLDRLGPSGSRGRPVDAGLRGPTAGRRRVGADPGRRHPAGDRRSWTVLWRDLSEVERQHRLDFLRRPDSGLAWAAYRWCEGDDLAEVLDESDLTAGDFVRWVKQLIDLCGQVADAAGDRALRDTARDVVRRIRRGVVAVAPLED